MILLCRKAGESRRGAGVLRPFERRDQPSPRLRHGRQDRALPSVAAPPRQARMCGRKHRTTRRRTGPSSGDVQQGGIVKRFRESPPPPFLRLVSSVRGALMRWTLWRCRGPGPDVSHSPLKHDSSIWKVPDAPFVGGTSGLDRRRSHACTSICICRSRLALAQCVSWACSC